MASYPSPPCVICGRPIGQKSSRLVTCGHPVCIKKNRRNGDTVRRHAYKRTVSEPPKRHDGPDERGRAQVRDVMQRHLGYGMSESSALIATAHEVDMTIAQVMSTWKSVSRG